MARTIRPEVSDVYLDAWIAKVRDSDSSIEEIPRLDIDRLSQDQFAKVLKEYRRVLEAVRQHIFDNQREGNFATSANATDFALRPADRMWVTQVRRRMRLETGGLWKAHEARGTEEDEKKERGKQEAHA
jgi:hypothetical protein